VNPIEDYRAFYANFIVKSAGSTDERLIAAFTSVRREDYVGPGPWSVYVGSGDYLKTISDDPRLLYQDILIGLAIDRGINNGQPSLHAACLVACDPRSSDTITHIGCGSGYYTAVLAELVGNTGYITAFEIESDLADRACSNLRHLPRVVVLGVSATDRPLPKSDVIYVNAGATHPLDVWLDALKLQGRLIFPLTTDKGFGCMLLITRISEAKYTAKALFRAGFIPCVGARDSATSDSIIAALEKQSLTSVRSLRRNSAPDATVWCASSGWWLSSADEFD